MYLVFQTLQRFLNMSSSVTRFCKVCFDAGKPKDIYTTHFVKDRPGPGGVVVCTTLLSQKCRYCQEPGHTPTHCPKLETRHATRPPAPRCSEWVERTPRKAIDYSRLVAPGAPRRERRPDTEVRHVHTTTNNRFAALLAQVEDTDSDDDDNQTTSDVVRKALFASGPAVVENPKKPVLVGWATMAAKPAVQVVDVVDVVDVVEKADTTQKTPIKKTKKTDTSWIVTRRWGDDDSDSDDESCHSAW